MDKDDNIIDSFNLTEVKEYSNDIECIKYLLNECKKRKIDSNLYYELVYFHNKFKLWLDYGIEDNLIRLTVEDLYSNLQSVLDSVSSKELSDIYDTRSRALPLKEYDKLKYGEENKINSNLGYVRQMYTDAVYSQEAEFKSILILLIFFIPLIFVFVSILVLLFMTLNQFTLKPLEELIESILIPFILVDVGFVLFMFISIYIPLLKLKYDSIVSYKTGVYNIQKPNEYKYYYSEEKNNFYLPDRVWRNSMLAFYITRYRSLYDYLYSGEYEVFIEKRYTYLASMELNYLLNFDSIVANGELSCKEDDWEKKYINKPYDKNNNKLVLEVREI